MGFDDSTLIDINNAQGYSEADDFTAERYAQFIRYFPATTCDVLDIGCNTGRGAAVLKARFSHLHIVGLDCVPDRLARLDPGIFDKTICGFADRVNLPGGSFDTIVAGEVLEHIPSSAVFPSLCECFRLLRLGGRFLATTPNPNYVKNRWRNQSVLQEPSHVSQHTPASLRRKLEDAGFSHIRVCGSGRMTRYVGQHFPLLSVYGSYLVMGVKW
jgi:SAM-dependent methyltransferase